ncbi:uncharacterized protein LOC115237269 [Formica exsecta]|uniref:uncharacterized protein LOC115237269 n=1 Tax=Formica exsecta TaxID=72781 RepID=UPI001144B8A1|nr:uncharacterized protein LOC115237269 [Formica exsecta]
MICVETQHFNLNRILLLALGLWPYQKSKFSQFQAILCFGILTSFVVFQILGTILYINESQLQSHTIQIVTEYFVDQEKYYYLILLHKDVVFCIGVTTSTAIGSTGLGCAIHACGIFKIASKLINHSYRVEQIMTTEMLKNINLKKRAMIYKKKIFYAVEIHCKAIKFINAGISNFKGLLLLIVIFGVICLSLNIYAVYWNATHGNKDEVLFYLFIIFAFFSYYFISNYVGEVLLSHNNYIYSTTYNIRWYMAPLHVQKMILFILQRGSQTTHLSIAGLFTPSLENFVIITKASISYFTVLCSMQQ